jgi:predicted nucleic acid-binding protein
VIVVDTNVLAYLLIPGDLTPAAAALLRHDPAWCAPTLWRSELRNVLALYLRRRELDLAGALNLLDYATQLVRGREYAIADGDVLELIEGSSCSGYDCEFVALSRELDLPLVTSDRRILRDFPAEARDLASFLPEKA